jgi:hypothetical protein
MRSAGNRAGDAEVTVPLPWNLGLRPEGPPPDDQPRAGLVAGDIVAPRLPGTLQRHGGPSPEERFGPKVVADGNGGYREDRETYDGRIDRDGSIHFNDKANVKADDLGIDPLRGLVLSGHFDLTDALMRAHGEDPYRYEKQRFMERTRDERAQMAVADRSDRLRDAVARMPAYLAKVWGHTAWTAAERRAALFSLWEEVTEQGDDELVKTGVAVRAAIVGFIKRRLPRGGADAYPDAELERLNQVRKSRAAFRPYD